MEKEKRLFDGGMGSMLQEMTGQMPRCPEDVNIDDPDTVVAIHAKYAQAGADFLTTNTFGANAIKFKESKYTLEQVIRAAIANAKKAGANCRIAFDMGPTGKLMQPMGDLDFDTAYTCFKEAAMLAQKHGADCVIVETMSDLYEIKAAILAVTENTDLDCYATVTLEENGRMLTGADAACAAEALSGFNIIGVGLNCSVGPDKMLDFAKQFTAVATKPVLIQPNAGLPHQQDGQVTYDITPVQFAHYCDQMLQSGIQYIGGCCGTTPQHIALVRKVLDDLDSAPVPKGEKIMITSGNVTAIYDESEPFASCGDSEDDLIDFVLDKKMDGAPYAAIDLCKVDAQTAGSLVKAAQEVCNLPMVFMTDDANAAQTIARYYNGRAGIRYVGEQQQSAQLCVACGALML